MTQNGGRLRTKAAPRLATVSAIALAGFLTAGGLATAAVAQEAGNGAGKPVTTQDRTGLALTIYNENLALVRDRRRVTLEDGVNRLSFQDISQQIRPETALLRAESTDLAVLEQSYQADLLTPQRLLEAHVGETVRLIRTNPETGQDTVENAVLLSAAGGLVLRIGDRVEIDPPGRVVLPGVPEGLHARPTLVATVDSGAAGETPVNLTYLTGGLGWRADYVAELDEAEDRLALRGWITLTNASGVPYQDARVQLVAGDVNQVQPMMYDRAEMMATKAQSAPMPAQQAMFEYHLYSLGQPITISENEVKQVALLAAADVPARKEYRFVGLNSAYDYPMQEPVRVSATVRLSFDNDKAASLGMPLPRGTVRVYGGGDETLFLGEDTIDHTPESQAVKLTLGRAFDVTATSRQTAFERIGDQVFEAAYAVELRNAKSEPVEVSVVEQLPGQWQVLEESHPHERESAQQAVWSVSIPADGTTELTYRVRVTY